MLQHVQRVPSLQQGRDPAQGRGRTRRVRACPDDPWEFPGCPAGRGGMWRGETRRAGNKKGALRRLFHFKSGGLIALTLGQESTCTAGCAADTAKKVTPNVTPNAPEWPHGLNGDCTRDRGGKTRPTKRTKIRTG